MDGAPVGPLFSEFYNSAVHAKWKDMQAYISQSIGPMNYAGFTQVGRYEAKQYEHG